MDELERCPATVGRLLGCRCSNTFAKLADITNMVGVDQGGGGSTDEPCWLNRRRMFAVPTLGRDFDCINMERARQVM